jgi:hypothetical protein
LPTEEKGIALMAGGVMQYGYQCGMIWGAALAAGAHSYHLYGAGPEAEAGAIGAAQRLVESFRDQNHNINCSEITNIDRTSTTMKMIVYFLIKGGTIGCMRMAAGYAKAAFGEINGAFSENTIIADDYPMSCSSVLARKLGASELHTTMVAGLAGGIGLCGGGCGALGTALWIAGMKSVEKPGSKISFKNPQALDIIDRFMKATSYEFECSKITGRKFADINDHADYVKSGGCRELIATLAGIQVSK